MYVRYMTYAVSVDTSPEEGASIQLFALDHRAHEGLLSCWRAHSISADRLSPATASSLLGPQTLSLCPERKSHSWKAVAGIF